MLNTQEKRDFYKQVVIAYIQSRHITTNDGIIHIAEQADTIGRHAVSNLKKLDSDLDTEKNNERYR